MKRLIVLTMAFVFLLSSVSLAAVPDPSAGLGDFQMGYNYYGMHKTSGGVDQGRTGLNELYGTFGIGFGYGGFVTHAEASHASYTDFGLKSTMLIPNVALMVGQRRMETDGRNDNNLFFGAAVRQGLPAGISVYASYQKGLKFKDQAIGVTYAMDKNSEMNLSWKDYDHNGTQFRGIGGGVNFKF